MSITIRKPFPEEEEIFVNLSFELTKFNYKHGPDLHDMEEVLEAREKRARKLFHDENPDRIILFAEVDGEIIGYTLAHIYRPSLATETLDSIVGNVDELYVDPNARSQGVGKKLLDEVSDWMKEEGATSMTLRMYAWNDHAAKFYQKEGFEVYDVAWQKEIE